MFLSDSYDIRLSESLVNPQTSPLSESAQPKLFNLQDRERKSHNPASTVTQLGGPLGGLHPLQTMIGTSASISKPLFTSSTSVFPKEGTSGAQGCKGLELDPSKFPSFRCPHCDYHTVIKHNYERHLKRHTGQRPFGCPYCPHRTTTKQNALSHMCYKHADREMGPHLVIRFSD